VFRFWRNPLLILHVRSSLRPARAAMAAALSLIVCVLIAMGCWSGNSGNLREFWAHFYGYLLGAQFGLLGVWSASMCGQAVAQERQLKTFDFLKTTRLTALEIMVGMVLGAPIVAYFIIACTLPITIVAGLIGGIRPFAILGSVVLLLAFNLFYSLVALLASMLVEKSSSGAVGLLGLLSNLFFLAFADSPFPGFATISVLPAVLSIHHVDVSMGHIHPTVFGFEAPGIVLSLVLYTLLGSWLVLMVVRNLKRDIPEIQPLSRWQCVGLAAFGNLLFYAFLDTSALTLNFGASSDHAYSIAAYAVAWNAVFLFLIGLAALSPHEKLKVWWRKWKARESSYFASDGLPWPWLVPAAIIGYAMLAAEGMGMRSAIPMGEWRLGIAALAFGAFLAFTIRDILFLQWCLLTRMKHPMMKGILVLALYNAAVSLVGLVLAVIATHSTAKALTLLTPFVMIRELDKPDIPAAFILAGVALQVGICVLILLAIQERLARPVHAPVGSES
jgi:hypothetical protein